MVYRVQVEADRDFKKADFTIATIYERTKYPCFREKGDGWWRVYCGSFESRENAEKRLAEIVKEFKKDRKFQNAFIREVEV